MVDGIHSADSIHLSLLSVFFVATKFVKKTLITSEEALSAARECHVMKHGAMKQQDQVKFTIPSEEPDSETGRKYHERDCLLRCDLSFTLSHLSVAVVYLASLLARFFRSTYLERNINHTQALHYYSRSRKIVLKW
jgi:hypothetical protein